METPMVEFVSYWDQYGSIECRFGRVEAWDGDVDVDEWFGTCRIWSRVQQGCYGSQAPLELAHHLWVVADGTFHVLEGTTSTLGSLLKANGKRIRSFELNAYLLNAASTFTRLTSFFITNCTNVEMFVMQVGYRYQDPSSLNTKIAFEWPMSCNLNKLKHVAVRGVEGFDCELEFE
ncbi:hypothetical protein Syun_022044 [Stephania yunnanensis]|uniref:Uncharacterized protein n=1 Tax=Stephania yunnanensis TaxID=152371 RepID=A0AAP0IIP4_9MAGN